MIAYTMAKSITYVLNYFNDLYFSFIVCSDFSLTPGEQFASLNWKGKRERSRAAALVLKFDYRERDQRRGRQAAVMGADPWRKER